MVEVGRDLWRLLGPSLLLRQGHLEPVVQDCPDDFLSICEDGDFTASLGNLCQCSVTLTMKKDFLTFRWNLLCVFVLIASGPVMAHH